MRIVPRTTETSAFRVLEWLCEPALNRVTGRGRTHQIEPKMMQVLVLLAGRAGGVVTRRELLDVVWAGNAVSEQVLSRAVSELRKVFEDDSRTPVVIETIAGSGYRLLPEVLPVLPSSGPSSSPSAEADGGRGSSRLWWPALAGAQLGGLLVGAIGWAVLAPVPDRPAEVPMRLSLLLPPEAPPEFRESRCLDISPDGSRLVYTASIDGRPQLYLRRLDRDGVEPIRGTEGGFGPFLSHDGSQVGFYVEGSLRRVAIDGGDPVTLSPDASDAIGATWSADGTIVFVRRFLEGLHWIPPGQSPRRLTELRHDQGEGSHFWPHFLPGGTHVLFTVWHGGSIDGCDVELLELAGGERRRLIEGGADARYVDGRILFTRAGTLMQVPFDLPRLEVQGAPSAVLEDLLTHPVTGAGNFAVAAGGTLIYAPRDAFAARRELVRIDASGNRQSLDTEFRGYATPQLSPDGGKLATTQVDDSMQIWLHDLARGSAERLTRGGSSYWPVWAPDGDQVFYSSDRSGTFNLYRQPARPDADAERLTESRNLQFPNSWSPDGRWLAYSEFHPDTRWDIWMLPLDGDRQPVLYLGSKFDEFRATFSPDGRTVAYVSNEGGRWDEHGRWEVYLRPHGDPQQRVQVSAGGGGDPRWSRDGTTLYFRQADRLMAVNVDAMPALRVGAPRLVLDGLRLAESAGMFPAYDVGPDGRFVTVRLAEPARPTELRVRRGGW